MCGTIYAMDCEQLSRALENEAFGSIPLVLIEFCRGSWRLVLDAAVDCCFSCFQVSLNRQWIKFTVTVLYSVEFSCKVKCNKIVHVSLLELKSEWNFPCVQFGFEFWKAD